MGELMNALGLIETKGMLGIIEACDVACKTSNVKIYNKQLIKGGIVTVEFIGDIGSIEVAIEAAVEATKKLGVYMSSNIMARPDLEIFELLDKAHEKIEKKKIDDITKTNEENIVIRDLIMKKNDVETLEVLESKEDSSQPKMAVKTKKIKKTKKGS